MSPEQQVPCPEIEEQLSAYLDGELRDEERETVDAHLAGCPECTSILEGLRETIRSVGSLPRLEAPEGFSDRMMGRIKPRRVTPIGWRIGALVAAASVMLVVSLYVGGILGSGDREGRLSARLHTKAPEAKLAGEPAPAAPVEEGHAVGRGMGPALELQMKKGAKIALDGQVVLLAFASDQQPAVDELIGGLSVEDSIRRDRRREKEEKDLDKGDPQEGEEPPPPPPLDSPESYFWKSPGAVRSRNLVQMEVDGLNRAQVDRNIRDLTLPQDRADKLLVELHRNGYKVLIWNPEEMRKEAAAEVEAEDGAAARKAVEAEELIGKMQKEHVRPKREALERAMGKEPAPRGAVEYYILRIRINP
jgi:anti-sigma factor RsiW